MRLPSTTAPNWQLANLWQYMRTMCRTELIAILVVMTALVVFAQQPTSHKAGVLKSHVPPANPEKYRAITDAPDWQNPYLIVQPNGVEVRTSGAAASGRTVSVADVIGYLGRLPKGTWHYGLVVVVQDNGVRNAEDAGSRIKRNRLELLRRLNEAGVRVELWPSA